MTTLARRALELLVEPAGAGSPPARLLDVGVVGLGAGCGATTVARGLALELPGDEVSDSVAPGRGGVMVAVAGRSAVPVLAALVSERLSRHHACVILVANNPEDPGEWLDTGAICLPPSRLSVALLARGRRARGPFGSALRNLARAVREAGA